MRAASEESGCCRSRPFLVAVLACVFLGSVCEGDARRTWAPFAAEREAIESWQAKQEKLDELARRIFAEARSLRDLPAETPIRWDDTRHEFFLDDEAAIARLDSAIAVRARAK